MTGVNATTTALAAGAAVGSTDVAKYAISDTYTELESQLRRLLNGGDRAQDTLLPESQESQTARVRVSADHARGVQLGDHNTQTHTFN